MPPARTRPLTVCVSTVRAATFARRASILRQFHARFLSVSSVEQKQLLEGVNRWSEMAHDDDGTLGVWCKTMCYTFSRAEIGETTSLACWRTELQRLSGIEPSAQHLCWIFWCDALDMPLKVGTEVRADGGHSVEELLPVLGALAESHAELARRTRGPFRSCLLLLKRGESATKCLTFLFRILQHWVQASRLDAQKVEAARASGVVPVQRFEQSAESHFSQLARSQTEPGIGVDNQPAAGDALPLADICFTAAVVREALHWFKREHFQWVDSPPCEHCGIRTLRLKGVDLPAASEALHAAERVEVYECPTDERGCGALVRFPRYNDALFLLTESRRGRCGEWAQAFALALCACSVPRVRLVFDFEDHIWTEFWSESRETWIHADPCEEALDQPHLYSCGWGKALSWVIAIEVGLRTCHLEDRSRVYVPRAHWPAMEERQARTAGDIDAASGLLRMLATLSGGKQYYSETAIAAEEHASESEGSTLEPGQHLQPRQSGAPAWIASRGENGPAIAKR